MCNILPISNNLLQIKTMKIEINFHNINRHIILYNLFIYTMHIKGMI